MATQALDSAEDTQFRLVGEDAPIWPGAISAALGLSLAFAASAQVFDYTAPPSLPISAPAPAVAERTPSAEPPAPMAPSAASIPAAPQRAEPIATRAAGAPPPPMAPPAAPPAASIPATPERAEPIAPPAVAPPPSDAPVVLPPAPPAASQAEAAPPTHVGAGAEARAREAAAATPPAAPSVAPCLPAVSITFDSNSSRLRRKGLEELVLPLRNWLIGHPESVLSVEGHADSKGSEDHNLLLSYARARAVASWLGRAGLPAARIAARAAGTSLPTVALPTVTTNRQVILQIEGVEPCRDSGASTNKP